jgi:hypothetical protein
VYIIQHDSMEINRLRAKFQASAAAYFMSSLLWDVCLTLQDGSHRLSPEVDNQLPIGAASNSRTGKASNKLGI